MLMLIVFSMPMLLLDYMSKQILTRVGSAFVIILFAIAAIYYYYLYLNRPGIDIRGFSGNITVIENNTVTLHGGFYGPQENIPEDLRSARDFSFKIDRKTEFKKIDIRWPTWEELATQGTSGNFKVQDLPRTESGGSFDDLVNLFSSLDTGRTIYLEVGFPASIYDSRSPTASSVLYQVIGIPASSP